MNTRTRPREEHGPGSQTQASSDLEYLDAEDEDALLRAYTRERHRNAHQEARPREYARPIYLVADRRRRIGA